MKAKKQEITQDQLVNLVQDETTEWLKSRESWASEHKESGSFIAYGLLNSVFDVLFSLAPSKASVVEIIQMSLSNFMSEEDLKNHFK